MGSKIKTQLVRWLRLFRFVVPLMAAGPAVAEEFVLDGDSPLVGRIGTYVTREEDVLLDVAWDNDLGYTQLMAANMGVNPWVPHADKIITLPGQYILPAVRSGIVVNLAWQRVFYFPPDGTRVLTFPAGVGVVGRDTPLGVTKVVRKQADPVWYPPPSIRAEHPELPGAVGPGLANPLGGYALYLGWQRYLIHGTNRPYGIGRNVSHGCLHLYPEDMERLFNEIEPGTPVTVIREETAVAWVGDSLYVQIFPDNEQANAIASEGAFAPAVPPDLHALVAAAAQERDAEIDWQAVEHAGFTRTGVPTVIGTTNRPTITTKDLAE